MSSLLQSTINTRSVLQNSLKYIRSDFPNNLTEDEIQWLIYNNILTIIDLRSEIEVEQRPCVLADISEFQYINLPVTGGNDIPQSKAHVHRVYLSMVDDVMREIITTIEAAQTNVLYFCTAGKDRTGVVSALLLSRMGARRDAIIKDYMQSADNLEDALRAYVNEHPAVDINIITPQESYMEDFLNKVRL